MAVIAATSGDTRRHKIIHLALWLSLQHGFVGIPLSSKKSALLHTSNGSILVYFQYLVFTLRFERNVSFLSLAGRVMTANK
jgi:hypothetical protein